MCAKISGRLNKTPLKVIKKPSQKPPKKGLKIAKEAPFGQDDQKKAGKLNKTKFPGYVPQSTCQKRYPKGPEEEAPDASRRSKSLQTCHREASRNWRTLKN